jgi:BirA family transcriptional regulator, biotin operon repressor / biotin---[acetyl-CoA-carboxylase] ligase
MAVYTDNCEYGGALLPDGALGPFVACNPPAMLPPADLPLLESWFDDVPSLHTAALAVPGWHHLLASDYAHGSQYDRLIQLVRQTPLPDRTAFIARTGTGFRGFRQRTWAAEPGNIHLTVHLAPARRMERFETVFTALSAVAACEAIDLVPGLAGRARIKWVNDVLVDGAKVAGVLAYTQTRDAVVTSVVLGIGLNVATTPQIERSPFVPAASSLAALAPEPAAVDTRRVLYDLLRALARNYDLVREHGFAPIMEQYRARSAVIGEEVTICADNGAEDGTPADRVLAAGRVEAVGDGLELHLAGRAEPVRTGRLILGRVSAQGVT